MTNRVSRFYFVVAVSAALGVTFAANAWATTLTSPKGTAYTGALAAASEGHTIFHDTSGLGITNECNVSLAAESVASHGSGVTAKVGLKSVGWTNCTNNWSYTTLKPGSLEIHAIAGTDNGKVTWTGGEVTTKQATSGLHCIYSTNNTSIGTLTSSTVTGGAATLDIGATIPRTGGSSGIFCGSSSTWTGSFAFSTPSTLSVDE